MKKNKRLNIKLSTKYFRSHRINPEAIKSNIPCTGTNTLAYERNLKDGSCIIDENEREDKVIASFDNIMSLLRSHTGHDFSSYKKNTVFRRIERRMGVNQVDKLENYVSFLQENPQELEFLFNEFLIGVTSFFRDPLEWELLKNKVIPELLAHRSPNDTLRVWVSGCSTGEEAYSIAITFKEVLEKLKPYKDFSMQIFATDLDINAINKAREGIFSTKIQEDLSSEYLDKYFVKVKRGYQVIKSIREMVIFAQQNMIKDPPFTKIDLLTCRNLLIYLTAEMQKKLIPLFHYSLNTGGVLFLGSAETIGTFTELFKVLDRKSRLYQRLQSSLKKEHVEFPTSFAPVQSVVSQLSTRVQNIQTQADKLILQYYSPATVLVNNKGDIRYITGRTGKYLEPASGDLNWNVFAMAREGLNYQLSNAFIKTLRDKEAVVLKNVSVLNEGGSQLVDISINPINEPDELKGMVLIVFNDVITPNEVLALSAAIENPTKNMREKELERELLQTRQMWQVASTEMQLSKEEFKASNEELQSTNEELQSTNEELTTTKEEVQSLNEELKTVNFELQTKLDDLYQATNDRKNQMDSTKIATLFLDNNLCVKHFTNQMSVVSRLIISDVGRPITDIASDLIYPSLTEDVKEVLRNRNTVEKQIMSNSGFWYNTKILPYYTLDKQIDGVVITFVDITQFKNHELDLNKEKLEKDKYSKETGFEQEKITTRAVTNEVEQSLMEVAVSKEPDNRK